MLKYHSSGMLSAPVQAQKPKGSFGYSCLGLKLAPYFLTISPDRDPAFIISKASAANFLYLYRYSCYKACWNYLFTEFWSGSPNLHHLALASRFPDSFAYRTWLLNRFCWCLIALRFPIVQQRASIFGSTKNIYDFRAIIRSITTSPCTFW